VQSGDCGLRSDECPLLLVAPEWCYNVGVNRRTFLGAMGAIPFLEMTAEAESIPIIDTHIHLFDPRRPQGVPWPPKDDSVLYHPALPERYRAVTHGLGIVGAIELECSPWLEDNQWVLDVAAKDPIIVGTVGDLDPAHPDFREHLDRFHRNPLFRGIRYGNLWGRNLGGELSRPEFVSNLKLLVDAGLELDTANPDPALISAVVQLTDEIPDLRVVIDHLPELEIPTESKARREVYANLRELGGRPQVYVKVSEVVRPIGGELHDDLSFYREKLDEFWETFSEDRLLYGSDWPNSDHSAPFERELSVVREYFNGKGRVAAEKFFWKNSVAAYHWVRRDASQPQSTVTSDQ
jgi:L-fuconolactonase